MPLPPGYRCEPQQLQQPGLQAHAGHGGLAVPVPPRRHLGLDQDDIFQRDLPHGLCGLPGQPGEVSCCSLQAAFQAASTRPTRVRVGLHVRLQAEENLLAVCQRRPCVLHGRL